MNRPTGPLPKLASFLASGFRWAALAAGLVVPSTATAGVVVTKIADTGTVVPEGNGGNFLGYFSGPAISNGTVAFYGAGGGRVGIYTGSGGAVTRVADNSQVVPSGNGSNFYDFGAPSISNGKVAFEAFGYTGGLRGIYTGSAAGGSLARVVDTTMNAPGAGRFTSFRYTPDIVGDTVAFHAGYTHQNGATYGIPFTAGSGGIEQMVTQAEIDSFGSIGAPQLSETGAVAFYGYKYSNWGIYTGNGGALTTIADRLDLVPGVNAQFVGFGNPSILGDTVVFSGNSSGIGSTLYGIFSGNGGDLTTLVDSTMAIPGGTGNFATFGENLALSSLGMAFTATDSAQRNALYLLINGVISKVAGVGDMLDGKVISGLTLTSNGLDGTTVAFTASFVGGTQGVYIGMAEAAAVPEPSTIVMAGVGLIVAIGAARRSRRDARGV